MAKGKKQTADDLIRRYSQETVSFQAATSEPTERSQAKKVNPILESLRRNVNRVVMIPIEILLIEENVRRQVDERSPEFLSLVDSVRENGIRQNIIVDLQDADEDKFKVVVIAGQRRVLAAKKAGVKQAAALMLRMGGRGQRLIEGLAENLLREDLHCLDQAEAYAALIDEGWTEEQIAGKFERRRRTILQFLRLARYPQKAKDLIRTHRETFTTFLLFNKFVAKKWKNDDELYRALKEVVTGRKTALKPQPPVPASLNRLIKSVSRYNGLECQVKGTEIAGKIIISFRGQTALQKIIDLFEKE